MNPVQTRLHTATLVSDEDMRATLGLYDDDSANELLPTLQASAESAVRAHLNRPVAGDTLDAWFTGWPDDNAYEIPRVAYSEVTAAAGRYWGTDNRVYTVPAAELHVDPTFDGRVACTANYALSTTYRAPVRVTLTELGSALAKPRVKECVLQVAKVLYASREPEDTNTRSVRAICAQLLGTATVEIWQQ